MAPALTKFVKDGHGIHLSSPPSSGEQALYTMDTMEQLKSSDDFQKILFNLAPSLDSYLQPNTLDLPSTCGSLVHSSQSYNRCFEGSNQAASILPGASDMFLVPPSEHNSQDAYLNHRHRATSKCRPSASDVHSYNCTNVTFSFENGDSSCFFAPTSNHQAFMSDQLVPRVELQDAVKERVCRQEGLQSRAEKLQRRLQILLGQHASLHCDQQLQGLKTQGYRNFPLDSSKQLSNVGTSGHHFAWPQSSPHFTDIIKFSQSSHAVLKDLQEALDSEATASSSSDDEQDDIKTPGENRETCVASPGRERQWLEERAELGSRWSWLQLRVSELDGRIQQLGELHKNIKSSKGRVVLAQSQPMTDRQIKQALLQEMAGLSCTALDVDNEPCSPTRLLHNIERQSAQLSQIVNSLMPPLNLSPLSKPWKEKRAFNSDVFVSGNLKRKKIGVRRRQLFKDDMSCVCARTRPLVTYHKPRLFRLNSTCNSSKCSGKSTSTLSGLASCSCSCSSCDPLRSDPDSSSNGTSSRTCSSTSQDSSLLSHFPKTSQREEWSQLPLIINSLPLSPVHYRRRSSTPLYNCHKYKHHKKNVLGLSPIRHHGAFFKQNKKVNNKKQKRRHRHSFTEDEDDDEEALSYWEDSSEEMLEECFTLVSQKQHSRGTVRRRHGESVFNIDNIVIPASWTKVEKLQYKDILTPSWQVVEPRSKSEADPEKGQDEQMEDLADEIFALRHLPLEQKEKQRWSFWGKKHCRHSSRSSSRLSSSGLCTSGEDNSVEWSFAQLETDEQLSPEECLPRAPWDRRVFPLNNDDEQALCSEVPQWCSQSTSTFSSSKSLNFDLLTSHSTDAASPSAGQYMNCTNNGS